MRLLFIEDEDGKKRMVIEYGNFFEVESKETLGNISNKNLTSFSMIGDSRYFGIENFYLKRGFVI